MNTHAEKLRQMAARYERNAHEDCVWENDPERLRSAADAMEEAEKALIECAQYMRVGLNPRDLENTAWDDMRRKGHKAASAALALLRGQNGSAR